MRVAGCPMGSAAGSSCPLLSTNWIPTRWCVCCWLPDGKRGRVVMPVVAAGPVRTSGYPVAIIAYVARRACQVPATTDELELGSGAVC